MGCLDARFIQPNRNPKNDFFFFYLNCYSFFNISVEIPTKQFNEWNQTNSKFTWQNKKPKVRYKTLQLPIDKGGMSLSCWENYYRAVQLQYTVYWCEEGMKQKGKN